MAMPGAGSGRRPPYLGAVWRAWYKRSRSIQASRQRLYETPAMPHERSTQSSLQRAPSRVWGVNCGAAAHADKTTGVSARMTSRRMCIPPVFTTPPSCLCRGSKSCPVRFSRLSSPLRDHTIVPRFRLQWGSGPSRVALRTAQTGGQSGQASGELWDHGGRGGTDFGSRTAR